LPQHAAHGRDLNGQIAFLDYEPGPSCLDQRIFGDRRARTLDQHAQKLDRALTEADRLGAAIQDSGLSIESERPKLVRGRHCWIAKKFGKILELFHEQFTTLFAGSDKI
jgi:hypothetical protein